MCIGSNSVNQAQDLMFVTKFEDFPNSLLPTIYNIDSISTSHPPISNTAGNEPSRCSKIYNHREASYSSWLKVSTSAFKYKTLLAWVLLIPGTLSPR